MVPICLFQVPFGHCQLVRSIAVVGFAIVAYCEYERKDVPLAIVFLGLAVLFQPLATIPLGGKCGSLSTWLLRWGW